MIIWDNLGGGFVSLEAEVVIQLWIHVIIMINVICVSSVYVWRLEIKLYHLAGHRIDYNANYRFLALWIAHVLIGQTFSVLIG